MTMISTSDFTVKVFLLLIAQNVKIRLVLGLQRLCFTQDWSINKFKHLYKFDWEILYLSTASRSSALFVPTNVFITGQHSYVRSIHHQNISYGTIIFRLMLEIADLE